MNKEIVKHSILKKKIYEQCYKIKNLNDKIKDIKKTWWFRLFGRKTKIYKLGD